MLILRFFPDPSISLKKNRSPGVFDILITSTKCAVLQKRGESAFSSFSFSIFYILRLDSIFYVLNLYLDLASVSC